MGWLIIPQFNSFIQSFSLALEKLDSIKLLRSLKSPQEVDVVMNLEKKKSRRQMINVYWMGSKAMYKLTK